MTTRGYKIIMEQYREKGFTNRQIAAVIGKSYQMVLNTIGPQPKALTRRSAYIAATHRWHVYPAALRKETEAYKNKMLEYGENLRIVNSKIESISRILEGQK